MSAEAEFARWLRRPEKSFVDNFRFALTAWQSADFTHSSKYDLVLCWLVEEGSKFAPTLTVENFPTEQFKELLQLRAPPGLIEQLTKRNFVLLMLELSELEALQPQQAQSVPLIAVILQRLTEFELLQDLYRTDYELFAQVSGKLLEQYELYLQQYYNATVAGQTTFSATRESEFFALIMGNLRDSVKRTGDVVQYDRFYCKHIVKPLAQVITLLRVHELCFFDEFLQLERLLTEEYEELELVQRVLGMPLHVRLLTVECAVANRRGIDSFLQLLLQHTFRKLTQPQEEAQRYREADTALALTAMAYTLEMLRKHDISLNFSMEEGMQQTALAYVGEQLLPLVQQYKEVYLYEVLLLLCAALRLNPLILEQDIFQVTTWMIVAPKREAAEQQLFESYLVLLMDMFRRLSRAEKLVYNLLFSIKGWLSKFQLPIAQQSRDKLKRKSVFGEATPAKQIKGATGGAALTRAKSKDVDFYLQIIFKDFHKPLDFGDQTVNHVVATSKSFQQLRSVWPSASVGVAFARLITGLVSKVSLVIWKSLLYALKELLETLQQEEQPLKENSILLLDLHAALLCQYFKGCRLAEQCDKFCREIKEQRRFTNELLKAFGHFVLSMEHHERTINAFLECGYHAANFSLLLAYYLPDGLPAVDADTQTLGPNLHSYLSAKEWAALQQRVLNFGSDNSNFLLNRLLLQRTQAQFLLEPSAAVPSPSVLKTLHSTVDSVNETQLKMLLLRVSCTPWFVAQLQRDEKATLLQQLLHKPQELGAIVNQLQLEELELLAFAVYAQLCQAFSTAGKCFLLAALSAEVSAVDQNVVTEANAAEKRQHKLVEIINAHVQKTHKLKPLPEAKRLEEMLQLLRLLPIGHLRRQSKNTLFTLQLSFYSDLSAAGADVFANEAFEILTDIMHFGQHVPIFKYFPTTTIIKLLPVASCWPFYELVFASSKNEERGTEQFLNALVEILEGAQAESKKLNDDHRRLLLIAIETLAATSGPSAARMRKQLGRFLDIYHKNVMAHFKQAESDDGAVKKHKRFVEKTLAGFAPYANALLVKAATKQNGEEVDENFRRICKIYIGYSMDYRNPHAIRLLQVALNHRQLLHLDQDEIEFVMSHYWRQLNADLKSQASATKAADTTEAVVKMIIGNKTNEDLLLTLRSLSEDPNDEKCFANTLRCLALIAKCSFSTIKGAIFNEKFKEILSNIILRLRKDEQQQFVQQGQVLNVLAAQQSIVENKMIPISLDTLDDILAFLIDINVKRFLLTDSSTPHFHRLHQAMSDLCAALIKQRHVLLMDRVPQFMHIFKDLTQSIVGYKSDRQKDTALPANELDDLAELAMKLEALSHLIATHSLHVKRVAPFLLTFIINLMVANKRATTLYPKIKTHIESVCYDLIGICDHRVGRFILRCSNEAARQVYEVLVKDHKKYHKFKGKV